MQREKTSINRSWLDWGAASKDEALNQIISIPSNLNFNTNPIPQFEFRDLNKQIKIKLYFTFFSASILSFSGSEVCFCLVSILNSFAKSLEDGHANKLLFQKK